MQEAGRASCGFAACDLVCGVLVNGGDDVRLSAQSRALRTTPERLPSGVLGSQCNKQASGRLLAELGSSALPLCLGGPSLIKTQRGGRRSRRTFWTQLFVMRVEWDGPGNQPSGTRAEELGPAPARQRHRPEQPRAAPSLWSPARDQKPSLLTSLAFN